MIGERKVIEVVNGGDNSIDLETQIETKGPSTSMKGWNTTWPSMPNSILVDAQKSQEVVNSQGKLIIVKEIFLDIGKQMLKISYTLNLG